MNKLQKVLSASFLAALPFLSSCASMELSPREENVAEKLQELMNGSGAKFKLKDAEHIVYHLMQTDESKTDGKDFEEQRNVLYTIAAQDPSILVVLAYHYEEAVKNENVEKQEQVMRELYQNARKFGVRNFPEPQ